jgi:putative peptide zinc metalloprotease protein
MLPIGRWETGVVTRSPPKLRSDLTIRRQETASGDGEGLFVIKDPVAGAFFRFGESEQFIAQQLDGETPLEVVRERTEARFGSTLPAASLGAFIERLAKAGLLEGTGRPRARDGKRRGGARGSLLYLRYPLLDPNALLDRLLPRVRACFTPHFLALSAAAIVLAAGITFAHWGELTQELARLYRPAAIPLLLTVFFVVGSAHEFAHGLTCKRFGGEVHELGVMLVYFTPGLYTNVSDAWLFPEKAKRLWVGFAGPYFELFLWALATLAWRLTEPDTTVNYLALTVMMVSGVKTLLNFNPLIKLDGYYLLSDYLELPNLRKKSFRYVGRAVKGVFGAGPEHAAEIPRRERRVYLAYGLLAAIGSLSILGYVTLTAGEFLIANHQPVALAVLTSLVGMKSRRRFRGLFGGSPAAADPSHNGDDEAVPVPNEPQQPAKPAKPAKKARKPRSRRRAIWLAVTAAALALLVLGRMQLRIGGGFTVLPEHNADVRTGVDGIIEEILVTEGDVVQAGDVIARLSNHTLINELQKSDPAIRETRAVLHKLETGPTAEEVAVGRSAISRAEDRLGYAQGHAARLARLFESGAATRQELEAAQELASTAENDVADARRRLDLLLRRNRPEDIEASRARLASLETQRRFLSGEARELTVASPVTGIVATPARQLKELQGQLLPRGALIAKVYAFTTVMAQIVVSEKDIADVHVGQPVALRVRALPGSVFRGAVTAIATAADGTPIAGAQTSAATAPGGSALPGRAFIVTTRIDNPDLVLKPGMTGWAKIYCGPRRIVEVLTRRVARTVRVEVWSWW